MSMASIVLIPARMGSTRLPGKVMALIKNQPMLWHVAERAIAANVGPVVICTDSVEVLNFCVTVGLHGVMTGQHATGTDRVAEALARVDPHRHYDLIVNVQADVPMIDPSSITALARMMDLQPHCNVGTLCAVDSSRKAAITPSVVKVIGAPINGDPNHLRALYFTRGVPWYEGPIHHHIGIYAYERAALERLHRLPQGVLERRENLEQLRALENGLTIHAAIIDSVPISVDTHADLERARAAMGP